MSGECGNTCLPPKEQHSRPWLHKFLAALVVILFVGLAWICFFQIPREPVYQGKGLTSWLQSYAPSSRGPNSPQWHEADEAVQHIGTNCIPILLRMLRAKDSDLKLRLVAFVQKQLFVKIHFVPAAERNVEASRAFIVLGDTAKGAVPLLVRMCNENISADSREAIEDAFAWIGPAAEPAIPLLLKAATNSNSKVRANALWALGGIHAKPELCVPELIRALEDSNGWPQLSAAHALGMFGTNAQPAIPFLTAIAARASFSNFNGVQVMQLDVPEARNALKKISPQALPPQSEPFEFGTPGADWSLPTQ